MFDEEKYEFMKEKDPTFARIWKAAVESFPDEGLRDYFKSYEKFGDFYNRMSHYYSNEEIRFYNMFDICPDMKKFATNPNLDGSAVSSIDIWANNAGWL
jgi:hypothetical protein